MSRESTSRDLLGVVIGSAVFLGGLGLAVESLIESGKYYFSENRGPVQLSSIQEPKGTGGIYVPNVKRYAIVSGACFFVGGFAGGLYECYIHRRRSDNARTVKAKVAIAP
jgi:hypothetical protein